MKLKWRAKQILHLCLNDILPELSGTGPWSILLSPKNASAPEE